MAKSTVVTPPIDRETGKAADALTERPDCSHSSIPVEAAANHPHEEAKVIAFIKEGEADLDAGRWVTHVDLIDEIRHRRAKGQVA